MNENTAIKTPTTTATSTGAAPRPDFFGDFAAAAEAVLELIERSEKNLDPGTAAKIVPACPGFTVADLLDHLLLVTGRIVAIGEGRHWAEITDEHIRAKTSGTAGWTDQYRRDLARIPELWFKREILGQNVEVPWGEIPGAAFLAHYTGELAVHGWDLAHATGQFFTVPDQHLGGAYEAGQFITSEMREHPDVPFEAATEVDPSASMLDQLAGLLGRPVGT